METELNPTMDSSTQEDVPVESTTGFSEDEELMYTTTVDDSGVEYQSAINDISAVNDLSGAQVAGITALLGVYSVFMLAIIAFSIVVMWKIFTKAGRAGWESLVPIYNIYVNLLIVGRPGWWLLLFFIPFVNIVIALLLAIDLAKSFGKSTTFGVIALFLFSLVGYAILAFGSAKYVGPSASQAPQAPAEPSAPTPEVAPPAAPAV